MNIDDALRKLTEMRDLGEEVDRFLRDSYPNGRLKSLLANTRRSLGKIIENIPLTLSAQMERYYDKKYFDGLTTVSLREADGPDAGLLFGDNSIDIHKKFCEKYGVRINNIKLQVFVDRMFNRIIPRKGPNKGVHIPGNGNLIFGTPVNSFSRYLAPKPRLAVLLTNLKTLVMVMKNRKLLSEAERSAIQRDISEGLGCTWGNYNVYELAEDDIIKSVRRYQNGRVDVTFKDKATARDVFITFFRDETYKDLELINTPVVIEPLPGQYDTGPGRLLNI